MNNNNFDNFPWTGNDIYLEDSKKQIKAICSNALIADMIAKTVNDSKKQNLTNTCQNITNTCQSTNEFDHTSKIQELIKASYILYVTLPKAKIQVKDIPTMFLEKAYHDFCNTLTDVLKDYHLDIKDQIGQIEKNKDSKQ